MTRRLFVIILLALLHGCVFFKHGIKDNIKWALCKDKSSRITLLKYTAYPGKALKPCYVHVLKFVFKYWDSDISPSLLKEETRCADACSLERMAAFARARGYSAEIVNLNYDDCISLLSRGVPIIAYTSIKAAGHFIVIVGYHDDGLVINDYNILECLNPDKSGSFVGLVILPP